eukprot:TRINITY_DN16564_c0_g1_i3.p1 TRINITY_DN16564_c0_g1~~TRINITY_DN16564_c0_g1_i3.p1  ORF type:complete len:497 (+),score=143.71 TRINITY_DN16564_c0_g1_i3:161-1651(+)
MAGGSLAATAARARHGRGTSAAGAAAQGDNGVKAEQRAHFQGSRLIRGTIEIQGEDVIGAKARVAIAEALAAVIGDRGSRVEVAWSPCAAITGSVCVAYTVRCADAKAAQAARRALEAEAAAGGAPRFLPRLLASLAALGGGGAAASLAALSASSAGEGSCSSPAATAALPGPRLVEFSIERPAGGGASRKAEPLEIGRDLLDTISATRQLLLCCQAPDVRGVSLEHVGDDRAHLRPDDDAVHLADAGEGDHYLPLPSEVGGSPTDGSVASPLDPSPQSTASTRGDAESAVAAAAHTRPQRLVKIAASSRELSLLPAPLQRCDSTTSEAASPAAAGLGGCRAASGAAVLEPALAGDAVARTLASPKADVASTSASALPAASAAGSARPGSMLGRAVSVGLLAAGYEGDDDEAEEERRRVRRKPPSPSQPESDYTYDGSEHGSSEASESEAEASSAEASESEAESAEAESAESDDESEASADDDGSRATRWFGWLTR